MLPQDRSDYRLYKVEKVGQLQNKIKVGQEVLISAQLPQEIKIKGEGKLENLFKLNSSDSIFAIVNA